MVNFGNLQVPARIGEGITGRSEGDSLELRPCFFNTQFSTRPVFTARIYLRILSTMLEINPINNLIKDLSERTDVLRGYL
ncbi:hypothetical protein SAMN04489856_104170 [Oleiphilus messinensis]|nr:hypothetical protein SAMN04489856_104170 [Oleiphilus messinensis]